LVAEPPPAEQDHRLQSSNFLRANLALRVDRTIKHDGPSDRRNDVHIYPCKVSLVNLENEGASQAIGLRVVPERAGTRAPT
jgi:hypothetical protein